jgi:hypothetical protein
MSLMGQASYRSSSAIRNAAAFTDADSVRAVITIRGRTGQRLNTMSREMTEGRENDMLRKLKTKFSIDF